MVSCVLAGACSNVGKKPSASGNEANVEVPRPSDVGSEESAVMRTYQNPILPGTHPDPSICRVGDDYYLVVSSFEYFPGVPIFHSKDLVHFRQIGYVLTRDSQLSLAQTKSSQGVFAPTIRHHNGTFYMVTTDMAGRGSFYVTATDPAGPWSDPIWVKESVFTMDPSLFFDDDGKVYYTRHGEQREGAIFQAEIDIKTGQLRSEPTQIWRGTGGIWPEGPHLYKVGGIYYLLISEGGTSYDHMVTVARSSSPRGPFEPYDKNPILTHRDLPSHPIQATGHADLVQTKEGAWWMVLLGIRPSTERHHHIGREVFLAPVEWESGWPIVNARKPLELSMSGERLPPPFPFKEEPARDEFDQEELGVAWRYVRNPHLENYSLSARPGFLRLLGTKTTMRDVASPTLVVRPQVSLRVRVSTEVHIDPKPGERAGLVVRGNEENHYQLLVEAGKQPGKRAVVLQTTIAGKSEEVARHPVDPGAITLVIQGEKDHYAFSFSQEDKAPITLGSAPTTHFAYEKTQSFTGAFLGLYAHSGVALSSGVASSSGVAVPSAADFAWFEMQSIP
jgi:xylan 1,4-beta-xylosidase